VVLVLLDKVLTEGRTLVVQTKFVVGVVVLRLRLQITMALQLQAGLV
jgi:hypothetical protein